MVKTVVYLNLKSFLEATKALKQFIIFYSTGQGPTCILFLMLNALHRSVFWVDSRTSFLYVTSFIKIFLLPILFLKKPKKYRKHKFFSFAIIKLVTHLVVRTSISCRIPYVIVYHVLVYSTSGPVSVLGTINNPKFFHG